MADVQQIETTVGQGDAIAGVAPIRHPLPKFLARNNLSMRLRQSVQGSQFNASGARDGRHRPDVELPGTLRGKISRG
jgi:hypothetical protein